MIFLEVGFFLLTMIVMGAGGAFASKLEERKDRIVIFLVASAASTILALMGNSLVWRDASDFFQGIPASQNSLTLGKTYEVLGEPVCVSQASETVGFLCFLRDKAGEVISVSLRDKPPSLFLYTEKDGETVFLPLYEPLSLEEAAEASAWEAR